MSGLRENISDVWRMSTLIGFLCRVNLSLEFKCFNTAQKILSLAFGLNAPKNTVTYILFKVWAKLYVYTLRQFYCLPTPRTSDHACGNRLV